MEYIWAKPRDREIYEKSDSRVGESAGFMKNERFTYDIRQKQKGVKRKTTENEDKSARTWEWVHSSEIVSFRSRERARLSWLRREWKLLLLLGAQFEDSCFRVGESQVFQKSDECMQRNEGVVVRSPQPYNI